MAIHHLHVRTHSRSDGRSAVAAAAYRAAVALVDGRTGERHDYSRKRGVVGTSLVLPQLASPWSRAELWDAAEAAEKRKNSCVARECEVALPHEVPLEDQARLANDFARWLSDRYSVAVDVALHQPTKMNDDRNVHAHMLMSTRALGAEGFGAKTRVLDAAATGGPEIEIWRAEWATRVNALLEARKLDIRVDHRSHAERGLIEIPTIKEGRTAGSAERKALNEQIRETNEQMNQLLAERAAAEAAEKIAQAKREAEETVRRIAAEEESRRAEVARQARADAERRARELVTEHDEREALRAVMSRAGREIYELRQRIGRAPSAESVRRSAEALRAANERSQQLKVQAASADRRLSKLPKWRFIARRKAEKQLADLQRAYRDLKAHRSALAATTQRVPAEALRDQLRDLEREHQARAARVNAPLPELTERDLELLTDDELRHRAGALVAIEPRPRSGRFDSPRPH